ncbi:hypothetical protein PGT21_012369 [Puccinia graminis f. sp. tritici]|uniref:Uncharacterized protein n=1 Tax=Puccinia graminis f. sp. tritici TaxID=56615 RepID=A0A5B0M2J0_PUCGR|nr:hypothetical protein PGT21_012369 [Puccinia graminis f. sp. tritici]KAA1089958.1 hypothetical protein PGTUg99_031385 [Puccinia graminis f. sp. tritici]
MKHYFIKYLYLQFLLMIYFHLALLNLNNVKKNKEFFFDLNETPMEDSIYPSSKSSETSFYDSKASLNSPSKKPMVFSTSEPHCSTFSKELFHDARLGGSSSREKVGSLTQGLQIISHSHSPTSSHKHKNENKNSEHGRNNLFCGIRGDKKLAEFSKKKQGGTEKNEMNREEKMSPEYSQSHEIHAAPVENSKFPLKNNVHVVNVNEEIFELLDVCNWNYVKVDPEQEIENPKKKDAEEFEPVQKMFKHLNGFRSGENLSHVFWIPRDEEITFFQNYCRSKDTLHYPDEISLPQRYFGIIKMLLRISDEKLELDQYFGFFKELKNQLNSKLSSKNKDIIFSRKYEFQVSKRMEYMRKTSKVTTTLSILYLSLFQEHLGGSLKNKNILDFSNFLQEFWKEIIKGDGQAFLNKNQFEKDLHEFLIFTENGNVKYSKARNNSHLLTISWRILGSWIERTERCSSLNLKEDLVYRRFLISIVNKIVFWSNLKSIHQSIKDEFKIRNTIELDQYSD